jgi:RNA polymerase sigma-70 factor, ECF subfamily
MAGPHYEDRPTLDLSVPLASVDEHREACIPAAAPQTAGVEPSPAGDYDTLLMLQVQAGNREAAGTLVRRNRERIERYIARLVRHSRAAEDLTQDVFLQALKNATSYRPSARLTTWLYRIATNVALNYLKQPAQARRVAAPPPDVPDRHESTPERRLTLDELKQQIIAALDSLPVNQRIALTLFQFEECSYEQIATVLDVTVEAVRSLLLRARTTLRSKLNDLM